MDLGTVQDAVQAAVDQLRAAGKRTSARAVRDIAGLRMEAILPILRDILKAEPPEENGGYDWRMDSRVIELQATAAALEAELASAESQLRDARRRRDEAPAVLRGLFKSVLEKRAPRADVSTFQAQQTEREATVAELEAKIEMIHHEREFLKDAIADAVKAAQAMVVAAMREDEQSDLHDLLALLEAESEVHGRLYRRYLLAGKQGLGAAVHGMHSNLWNSDAVRLQRGISPACRFEFGGVFRERYNRLLAACGMPADKGIETPETLAARDAIQREKAAHDALPEVAAHRLASEQYQAERQAERAREHRAHVAATALALQDALRR